MPSDVEICNLALSHIAVGKEIALLTESSEEARACNRYFTTARDEVLRDYPWPFATVFINPALVATSPTTEWSFSYRYPTDSVKLRRILSGLRNDTRQSRVPYRIAQDAQGLLMLTDMSEACLEYTKRETDISRWPIDAAMAFSFLLANYIAPRLTAGDPFDLQKRLTALYVYELTKAQSTAVNEEQQEENPEAEAMRARL